MMNRRRGGVPQGGGAGSPGLSRLMLSLGAVLASGAGVGACTLTNDSFDPALVSSPDAGVRSAVDDSSAPLNEDTPSRGSCSEQPGIAFNGDSDCPSSVGLLPTEGGSGAEAEVDAGPIFEPIPSLSLPPCEGELGAFQAPERVRGVDFDGNVFGPSLSTDGRTLYFSAYRDGEQQIYAATRDERGTTFDDVRELEGVNSPGSDGSPFISADGQRLYLFSERLGGVGLRDVWVSQRASEGSRFSSPELLAGINSPTTDLLPWVSADELTLILVSDRPGGPGGSDLWAASRDDIDDEFDTPNSMFSLSSSDNEGRAVLSSDGLTAIFSSDRPGGSGGHDLWMATREARRQGFSTPFNLGALNSPANDQDVALSSDDTELFFASSRGGASTLWRAQRSCE